MLEIDGSYGEGGGSIVRVAAGLAVATQKPIRVFNIRKNRPKPGLRTQHMHGLKAAAELCSGTLKGAELHSTEIEFTPGAGWKEKVKVHIPTAGSVGLVLQVLQIASVTAPKPVKVEISGGATFGKWAPPMPFLQNVVSIHLNRMNYKIEMDVAQHGFFPKGGAKISAVFNPPSKLSPIELVELGNIEKISGISIASELLKHAKVAERQKIAARHNIFKELEISPKIEAQYVDSVCPGSGICLWLESSSGCILGSGAIGERGVRAEQIGLDGTKTLVSDFKAGNTVDRYVLDQIVPFMALCEESSKIKVKELTNHCKTNIWVSEQFLGKRFSFETGILSTKPV